VLTTGNRLLPFRIIDLRCGAGYLRDISPHQRKPLARKILLADDSVTAQNMGRKILADAGYEVITVNNGSAALKKIAEVKPDLIVLDVYMPGYSGLEVCQRVKEAGETSRIPILLTVGKLEPFKPEEAKRVRAEGFIVKPFEASELLSALTKLEDKMVPRSESSKPGRFARAIAAVEEGRYDKTVAMNEDTGWKNRISFPSKKKRARAEAEDGDDPAIYNAVNKDLRTVIDRHPAPVVAQATATEAKVDLGALTPEGLPKDVTPEEIAALAAAAAQIQGKVAETKIVEAKPPDIHPVEPPRAGHLPEQLAVSVNQTAPGPAPEPAKPESATATHAREQPSSEHAAMVASAVAHSDQPVAKEKESAQETPAWTLGETAQPAASLAAPTPAHVMAAISSLETAGAPIALTTVSGSGFGAEGLASQPEAEPVTMAVAASAEQATPSRWTAVSMALAPEETGINLEDEMRTALASVAVVESPGVEAAASAPEPQPALAAPAATAEIPLPVEPGHQVLAPVAESGVFETSGATESTATDVIRVEVKEFETVTAPSAPDAAPAESETAPQTIDSATPPSWEAPQPADAKAEEKEIPVAPIAEMEPSMAEAVAGPTQHEESRHEELTPEGASEPTGAQKSKEPAILAPMASAETEESPAIVERLETIEPVAVSQVPADHPLEENAPTPELAKSADTTHGGIPEMAKKESDIAATTAAAWASWRRVRETADPRDPAQSKNKAEEKAPTEEAAMAVAAGAEKSPEDVPAASESPEIASIVDSVLADLRPKIVEEITRKLGKKR
jgi:CheY-like chemotaxis protein